MKLGRISFRKKAKAAELPDLANLPRLTRRELEATLAAPNGPNRLRAQREFSVQASIGFEKSIDQTKEYLAFLQAMKTNADGVVADIDAIAGEVEA